MMFPYRGTNPENWHLVYKQLWKSEKVCRCAVPFWRHDTQRIRLFRGLSIMYLIKRGILLPRAADEQFGRGERVSVNRLEPGDLVFFSTYESGVSHSGLYLGDGYFISATSSCGVAVATMKNGYWHDRYVGAKRVL